ncbi:MAG: hypothetical protein ACJASV_003053 [Pseudorhodobacter sp.]|jgi:hypothetical protein
MIEPVLKVLEVPCSPDAAFRVFTENFSAWWPKDKHSVSAMGGASAQSVMLEPHEGGAVAEIAADGTRHSWGTVKTFDPPATLTLLWHIGRPATDATLMDTTFEANAKVTLKHHDWGKLGEAATAMREGYNNGWVHVFEACFAKACAKLAA